MKNIVRTNIAYLILTAFFFSIFATESSAQSSSSSRVLFVCALHRGHPATIAIHPTRGAVVLISWRSEIFGSEHTPQRRCRTASGRLDTLISTGILRYLILARNNGAYVACSSANAPSSTIPLCPTENVIITFSAGVDPDEAMLRLNSINRNESSQPFINAPASFIFE